MARIKISIQKNEVKIILKQKEMGKGNPEKEVEEHLLKKSSESR
jgi:hypothetical protein